MKRNFVIALFVTLALFILLFLFVMPVIHAYEKQLSENILLEYEETKDPLIKNEIVKSVLTTAKKTDWLENIESSSLNITYGNIRNDKEKDAIIVIKIGEKTSIVVVYSKEKDYYKYLDTVDTFFDIKDVQLLHLKDSGKDLILVREYANQLVGAYEEGTFIRAYIQDDSKFNIVLNITEDFTAYWNELWDNNKTKDDNHWLKIKQSTKVKWENGMHPVLHVLYQQSYSSSNAINQVKLPEPNDFTVISTKEVAENYYWSNKWKHFILTEGTYTKTNQPVAIIENLSNSPFALAQKINDKLRIKFKDGKTEIVDTTLIS